MSKIIGIRGKAMTQLLVALQNLGCSYVVIDQEGIEHVHGDPLKKEKAKRPRKYPLRAMQNYYLPWIKDLEPGGATEIPVGEFTLKDLQAGVASKASAMWGNGTYITSRNPEKNVLEVLRIT